MKKILSVMLAYMLFSCGPALNSSSIRLAMEDDILTLNPYGHDDSIAHSVLSNIYDALVAFDGEMRITPALAVRWETPSDLVWRFFLRPGVSFHNGRPLSAGDVKYSLELARKDKVGHYLSQVKEVRILDSLTLELITGRPAPLLLNKLTFIDIVPQGWQKLETQPMGTGAYRFVRYQKGHSLELEANKHYWRGEPRIKKAVFVTIPDDSIRCQALMDGDIQLIRDVGERQADKVKNMAGVRFISRPGLGVTLLGINFNLPGPLQDRRVRKAVYLAIDPAALVRESQSEAEGTDQLVTSYITGYLPDFSQPRPQREKARMLLAQAGYPTGFKVDLEMSQTAALRSGPHIASQLGRLGIIARVKSLPWEQMNGRLEQGISPFYLVGWSNSSGDASDLLEGCLHTREKGRFGTANYGGYSNPELDRLIEQCQSTIDGRERTGLLHRTMMLVHEDMPLIPLYIRNRTYGSSSSVSFEPRQDGRIKLFEISYIE